MFRTTILSAVLLASATTALAAPTETRSSKEITPIATSAEQIRREKATRVADINGDKVVSIQDQYDFFEAWGLAMEKGEASVQDLYNWLEAYHYATTPVSSGK